MKVLPIAKKLSDMGLVNLSDFIVTQKFGKQIGRTSKSGARCFSGGSKIEAPFWRPDDSFIKTTDNVYTAIDKDFNIIGQTAYIRSLGYLDKIHTSIERYMPPMPNDVTGAHRLNVLFFPGKHIKDLETGDVVFCEQLGERKYFNPEEIYKGKKEPSCTSKYGEVIEESYGYAYSVNRQDGKFEKKVINISPIYGGKTFVESIRALFQKTGVVK